MKTPERIISQAIKKYKPFKFVLMVSGGHDSITNAHVTADILTRKGIPFCIYHGDTTIGIRQTQEYVKMICEKNGWDLNIRKPPNKEDWYDSIVAKYGFPGPTKTAHQYMYRRLKERALRHFVTHEMKTGPHKRQNVILFSGVRQQESRIRMGYKNESSKDDSRIWCNPIFYFSEARVSEYMAANNIPLNPVKVAICISGECCCGAFAGKEEYMEIKTAFPEMGARLDELHEIAKANGHPWGWTSGPNEWKKEQAAEKKGKKQKVNFMCVGCEKKYA